MKNKVKRHGEDGINEFAHKVNLLEALDSFDLTIDENIHTFGIPDLEDPPENEAINTKHKNLMEATSDNDITTKLFPNGRHLIYLHNHVIGIVYRFKNSKYFGLQLYKFYWDSKGNISTNGGQSVKKFKRMKDAIGYTKELYIKNKFLKNV